MKKKSLFTLFTSLIVCGLLLVGSVNAMTYTVHGDHTQIKIPQNPTDDNMIINRGDGNTTPITTCNSDTLANNVPAYSCEKIYSGTNDYTITISNPNSKLVKLIFLAGANITNIADFSGFNSLTTIRLNNNNITNLSSNLFNSFSNNSVTIYLDYNSLTGYNAYLSKIGTLYLTHNQLTTIPNTIWNARGEFDITLDDNTTIGNNGGKLIDLSNNPINFIGITKVGENNCTNLYNCGFTDTTEYDFERFGYANGTTNLSYRYEILYQHNSIKSGTVSNSTGITIDDTPLKPGPYYTFKISLEDNPDINKSIDFTVSYDEDIEITSPDNQEYTSLDNISGERKRTGNYPEELLSGYEYIIKKGNEEIARGSIHLNNTHNCSNSYWTNYKNCTEIDINSLIINSLGGDNPNGTYELTVYLVDKDNNLAKSYIYYNDYNNSWQDVSAEKTFTIAIPEGDDPTITINRPLNPETGAVTYFSWTPTIDSGYFNFNNYYWSISGIDNSTLLTGLIENENKTSFSTGGLNNGSYTFNVMLNYTKKSNGETGTATDDTYSANGGAKPFSVSKTYPSITINKPYDLETGLEIRFKWTPNITEGFEFVSYEWTISGNNSIRTGKITDKNVTQMVYVQDSFFNNGEYTFNIKLNYIQTGNGKTGVTIATKNFRIGIPSYLSIISPESGANLSGSTIEFSRISHTYNTFIKHEYSITGNNYIFTGSTGNQNSTTAFSLKNLVDGPYTFTVTMFYNDGTEKSISKTSNFNIIASSGAYIRINNPENGKSYTGKNIKLVPINFTWEGTGSSRISKFSYILKNTITNAQTGGTVNKNSNGIYNIPGNSLPSGTYRFEVTMLDDEDNPIIPTVSHTFNIIIPPYLEIVTPPEGQLSVKDIAFSRSGFAEFEDHYKYELNKVDNQGNILSTIKTGDNISLSTRSFSLQNLHNGKYTFTVKLMNSGNNEIINKSRTFWIPDDQDLILDISDGITSTRIIKSGTGIFSWGGKSEDFSGYYYSISGTNFKNEPFIYTGKTSGEITGSITLTNLLSGRYRFLVNMLDENDVIITGKYLDFNVQIPARLKITSPTSGSTITSSSYTFNWTGYSDIISGYEYKLTKSGDTQTGTNTFTTNNSFSANLSNGEYTLNVRISSGGQLVAHDSTSFTVAIKKSSGGGGGGSSSNSHRTNDLSVSITNKEPTTNDWVEVIVDINDKYTGKVDFTKMQYYSPDEEKRIDIPVTSKNYVSDYSDDAKLGYVRFDSNDDGEKQLSQFLKFSENGNYRIYVQDKDGYKDYVQFYVGKGNKTQLTSTTTKGSNDDEYYIARSCKKYKLEYLDDLGVRTSPNLKMNEYFINKDYFKRYIDSKNKQIDGCPTNIGWISTTYSDKSNSSKQYTAPNGKVYFISQENGSYSSNELNKELNGTKNFSSLNNLKYFIRDRNHFLNMTLPVK